ncbi:MAG: LytTR family transcriptional regulator DNA-binding domain-containing protein [Agathobacter sp.]|nr:LytTR family transcriptional regulator DNA-binding domain-containing protein [Agathobacter sp.]
MTDENANTEYYIFEKKNKILKLKSNDILAVVKIGKNMEITLASGRKESYRLSLVSAFGEMDNENNSELIYVNRGTIVNVNMISCIKDDKVIMKNGGVFQASLTRINNIRKKFIRCNKEKQNMKI